MFDSCSTTQYHGKVAPVVMGIGQFSGFSNYRAATPIRAVATPLQQTPFISLQQSPLVSSCFIA